MPEITPRPVARPAIGFGAESEMTLLCERGDSNPHALRRQILRLSLVVWSAVASRSSALFRAVFGEGSRGLARGRVRHVPSYVPPRLTGVSSADMLRWAGLR